MTTTQPSQIQLQVTGGDHHDDIKQSPTTAARKKNNYWWWVKVTIYTILVLLGQSVALLLGRLYFLKGGTSKWISSLVQVAGFPILIPYYLLAPAASTKPKTKIHDRNPVEPPPSSRFILGLFYVWLGLLIGVDTYLHSMGLKYLPVSTYTLICSSQLAFNSFFAYFLNSVKFTSHVVNSLVLLTLSSVLLVFNHQNDAAGGVAGPHHPRVKYMTGFLSTLAASGLAGLILSLTELISVRWTTSFKGIMDMTLSANITASVVTLAGLFASGEWEMIGREMESYGSGTASYVMTLVWIAVFWQLSFVGIVGLIFEVSSLFSNSISVVGLPIVPVVAVFVFGDRMSGIKGVSLALAVWGFVSYVYPFYVEDREATAAGDKVADGCPATDCENC